MQLLDSIKHKIIKCTLQLTIILFAFIQLNAQQKEISGTILDEEGVPFPGINIIVSGTKNGTQTDFDGNYKILVNEGDKLVFSFITYITETKIVGKNNNISFAMKDDPKFVITGCYFGKPRIDSKVTYQYVKIRFN